MLLYVMLGLVGLVFLVGVLLVLFDGWTSIKEEEKGVLQRFGKHRAVLPGGFHLKLPLIDRVVCRMSLRTCEKIFSAGNPTSDDVTVEYEVAVQYRVTDVFKAFYGLDDPTSQIESYVEEVIRSVLPEMDFKEALKNRSRVKEAIINQLKDWMENYGYHIENAPVRDVRIPQALSEQMNKKRTADFAAEAAKQEGEANRVKVVAAAAADAESKKLAGEGVANQRIAIARGIKESADVIKSALGDVSAEEVMSTLMLDRHMDTLRDMAHTSGCKVIFVPYGPGAMNDLSVQIRNGMMHSSAANETSTASSSNA